MDYKLDTSFIGKPHEWDPRRLYSQTGADWQYRVDFERLRRERLQRTRRFKRLADDHQRTDRDQCLVTEAGEELLRPERHAIRLVGKQLEARDQHDEYGQTRCLERQVVTREQEQGHRSKQQYSNAMNVRGNSLQLILAGLLLYCDRWSPVCE